MPRGLPVQRQWLLMYRASPAECIQEAEDVQPTSSKWEVGYRILDARALKLILTINEPYTGSFVAHTGEQVL